MSGTRLDALTSWHADWKGLRVAVLGLSVTGFSVLDYVKRLRMARSRQLLITSEHSVAEIGAAVGYVDPFYFSRQFREVNGQSPREFRRQSRAEAVTTPAPE